MINHNSIYNNFINSDKENFLYSLIRIKELIISYNDLNIDIQDNIEEMCSRFFQDKEKCNKMLSIDREALSDRELFLVSLTDKIDQLLINCSFKQMAAIKTFLNKIKYFDTNNLFKIKGKIRSMLSEDSISELIEELIQVLSDSNTSITFKDYYCAVIGYTGELTKLSKTELVPFANEKNDGYPDYYLAAKYRVCGNTISMYKPFIVNKKFTDLSEQEQLYYIANADHDKVETYIGKISNPPELIQNFYLIQ